MASLALDPGSGFYRIVFWFGGKQFRRSLKVRDERRAEAIRGRVEETLALIQNGRLTIPPDAEPGTFILSDGKLQRRPVVETAPAPDRATIGRLLAVYKAELPSGAKEESSLRTERIHLAHVERLLGADTPLAAIDLSAAQRYVKARGRETHGKKVNRPIRPYTIRKELKSFRHVWAWCHSRSLVEPGPAWELVEITLPRDKEPEPFRTMEEIRERIKRGGLTPAEERSLWECLYLTGPELMRMLTHVRAVPLEGFVHPMFAFAVFTGARRSEMLRSHIDDFDFRTGRVQIREKKRVKGKASVRWVDLHPDLSGIMKAWFGRHPGGQFTLAQDDGTPLNVDLMDHRFAMALRGTEWAVVRGFHVLRHSFASVLASKGVDQRIINSFMGHQTDAMAARYRHLFPQTLRSAILVLTS
jgi:integrase